MALLHISSYFLRQKEEVLPGRKYTMSKSKDWDHQTFVANGKYFFMTQQNLSEHLLCSRCEL